ncbi:hypothetical protein [Methylobrevis pamukkalensis]|uniref:Uncharacterized protein n=1 Tax=Methylobrevis pamukkalensis TaxID=1439726 RepID=A0A1E3H8I9_9HYPH|nr:hypothetical protein [Methylobrevis pamukkalensis]ODN72623.1 hypothetical protein A6302_00116 [Methylobrevis pamukkalensis]
MIANIPLTLIPLVVFNLFAFDLAGQAGGGDPWLVPLFTIEMLSGARFTPTSGDMMIVAGIVCLFVEILKATRFGTGALADHLMSMLVFVMYLAEFLTIAAAAHSVFVILTVIAFIDVVAGFSISIAGARRDVSFGADDR